jgi:Fic-DOC domain mobile mystery protein B
LTDLTDAEPEGATPLTPEARAGLIPSHVTLRRELNEVEQQNIAEAVFWSLGRRHNPVSVPFCRNLHVRMFGEVWRWAGTYRRHDTNIGCDHRQIEQQLHQLTGSARYWIEHRTFPADEIAVRYHHGLVAIHPFPNGNGRWSRLMGDILVRRLNGETFTWGGSRLLSDDAMRSAYIAALRKADRLAFDDLIAFARS